MKSWTNHKTLGFCFLDLKFRGPLPRVRVCAWVGCRADLTCWELSCGLSILPGDVFSPETFRLATLLILVSMRQGFLGEVTK